MNYDEFLNGKMLSVKKTGLKNIPALNGLCFPYQKDVISFLLECGKGAAFLDTGMGKSLVALEYGRCVLEAENKPLLMLAPLAVGKQHEREAVKFGIPDVKYVRNQDQTIKGINITNYENMHNFDLQSFCGVILDESSIIKSFAGKTTRKMMEVFGEYKYKLACTATPSPNDHMELGQHSQFLDVMDSSEMLARWFIADQSKMGKYRVKQHGVKDFWSWVASWSRCLSKPSDLGYSDEGFTLTPLNQIKHIIKADITESTNGLLFRIPEVSATSIHNEKRLTIRDRAEKAAQIVAGIPECEQIAIWCDTDYEADEIMRIIPEANEVRGSMTPEKKEEILDGFTTGQLRIILTKPRLAGFGLNWQNCHEAIFAGLSFSYEQYYQAIRRFHRFGQKKQVNAHIVMSDTENIIWQTIQRKMIDHENMKHEMSDAMSRAVVSRGVKNAYSGIMKPTLPSFI